MRYQLRVAILVAVGILGCKGEKRSPLLEAARTCAHEAELSCPRPIFNVANLRASQRYFRDVLAFKLDWEDGDPPDFASVSRGDAVIFMCEGCQGKGGAWTMTFTHDVDRLYQEFSARKALIRVPPKDMPWRLRELHVSDPDGNMLRFAAPIEH